MRTTQRDFQHLNVLMSRFRRHESAESHDHTSVSTGLSTEVRTQSQKPLCQAGHRGETTHYGVNAAIITCESADANSRQPSTSCSQRDPCVGAGEMRIVMQHEHGAALSR